MTKKYLIGLVILVALGIFLLVKVFSGDWIVSQQWTFGFWSIRWYSLCMALAVFAGYIFAQKRRARFGIGVQKSDLILFWVVLSGFAGARVYHIISDLGYYRLNPLEALLVWHGGLSIYGAILGGLIGLGLLVWRQYSKAERLLVYGKILDWLVPSVLVGQIIGRFGNFFNYELFGYPTALPWKMFVPEDFRTPGYYVSEYYHPLFLYEAIANFVILIFLLRFVDKTARPGHLFLWYVLLYNSSRFFLEFLRIDAVFWQNFRINAGVSLLLILLSGITLLYFYVRKTPQNN